MGAGDGKIGGLDVRMEKNSGQGSVEWLMTHAWAIVVVLAVASVLSYGGLFDTAARPRFEGLDAAAVKPISDQVLLYSDGVLVLIVRNTRPYTYTYGWVEVSPMVDKNDVIRTNLNAALEQGEIGVFDIDASNLLGGVSPAGLLALESSQAGQRTVDFNICFFESGSIGDTVRSQVVCGVGRQIQYIDEPGSSVTTTTCYRPQVWCGCPCTSDEFCQDMYGVCYVCGVCVQGYLGGPPDVPGHCQDRCDATLGMPWVCIPDAGRPEGYYCYDTTWDE